MRCAVDVVVCGDGTCPGDWPGTKLHLQGAPMGHGQPTPTTGHLQYWRALKRLIVALALSLLRPNAPSFLEVGANGSFVSMFRVTLSRYEGCGQKEGSTSPMRGEGGKGNAHTA